MARGGEHQVGGGEEVRDALGGLVAEQADPLGDARWYEPGSTKLSILLVLSLLPGFVQQLITFRYIGLRPELSIVVKSGRKYPPPPTPRRPE